MIVYDPHITEIAYVYPIINGDKSDLSGRGSDNQKIEHGLLAGPQLGHTWR
jgi:hypothetical protein